MPRVVAVIPTYNERANLPILIEHLMQLVNVSAIVVDDDSPDGTGEIADALAVTHPGRIDVLHRPMKAGIGPAYRAGFARAFERGADVIVQMDADLSHDPGALPHMVGLVATADVVIGSRYVPGGETIGWPWYRRLISRTGGAYARLVLGVPVRDLTGGYKAFRLSALQNLQIERIVSDGYVFQIETTYRAIRRGLRVVEAPITFTDRVNGKSKLSRRIVFEAMIVVWRLRFSREK